MIYHYSCDEYFKPSPSMQINWAICLEHFVPQFYSTSSEVSIIIIVVHVTIISYHLPYDATLRNVSKAIARITSSNFLILFLAKHVIIHFQEDVPPRLGFSARGSSCDGCKMNEWRRESPRFGKTRATVIAFQGRARNNRLDCDFEVMSKNAGFEKFLPSKFKSGKS